MSFPNRYWSNIYLINQQIIIIDFCYHIGFIRNKLLNNKDTTIQSNDNLKKDMFYFNNIVDEKIDKDGGS